MSIDVSKLCADFLRQNHAPQSTKKLKASHARELVAAFFGYKSHAAFMAEKANLLVKIEEAGIFIPDMPLIDERRTKLNGLPSDLLQTIELAKLLSNMLVDKWLFSWKVWGSETLKSGSYEKELVLKREQTLFKTSIDATNDYKMQHVLSEDKKILSQLISGFILVLTLEIKTMQKLG